MVAITGDTAASSFRMMLFMVLSSCGLRRHLGTGEPTLLNVSRLIFDVENESSTVHKEKIERQEKGEEGWGLDAAPSPGRVRTGCPGSPRSARRTRSGTFSFNDTPAPEIYSLSLRAGLPISCLCSTSPTSKPRGRSG